MDDSKRKRIGFLGSLAFHLVVFLLVAATGIFAAVNQTAESDDIVDVSMYGTGPGGGGGGGGNGGAEATLTHGKGTLTATTKTTDAITENNKNPEDVSKTSNVEDNSTQNNAGDTDQNSDSSVGGDSAGTGGGSGGGTGTGEGTGTGSGQGPGSGSGSGGGNGSGHGSGNGDGNNQAAADLTERPHVVGGQAPVIPQSARQRGPHSARMVVAIVVGTQGNVESVGVASSSGYADLDTAGINAAYSYSFTPGRNRYGEAIRTRVHIPFVFNVR